MAQEPEAYLLHYYIQKGLPPSGVEELLNLPQLGKDVYTASMLLAREERKAFWGVKGG